MLYEPGRGIFSIPQHRNAVKDNIITTDK